VAKRPRFQYAESPSLDTPFERAIHDSERLSAAEDVDTIMREAKLYDSDALTLHLDNMFRWGAGDSTFHNSYYVPNREMAFFMKAVSSAQARVSSWRDRAQVFYVVLYIVGSLLAIRSLALSESGVAHPKA
jgi:hypothetical protein